MRKKERTGNVRKILWMVLALLVLTPYIGLYAVKCWYDDKINDIANARFIIVDKETLQLHLMDYQGNEEKKKKIRWVIITAVITIIFL